MSYPGGGTPIDTIETLRAQLDSAQRGLASSEQAGQAGREREMLLRNELQHRVRNIISLVRSIFSRTVASGGSLEGVADHFYGRLNTLSRYQSWSAANPNGVTDLHAMIGDELRAFEFDPRVRVDGPETAIPDEIALVLGLALHELATNAIKFGALSDSRQSGLQVSWRRIGGSLALRWEETGVPVVATARVRSGFGCEFIENALPYQLDAITSWELRPGGLVCTVQFSIASNRSPKI